MSKWDDRLREHPVRVALAAALSAVKGLPDSHVLIATEDVNRLDWVLEHAIARLEHANPRAVSLGVLSSIADNANAMIAHLANFSGTAATGYLDNANAQADQILALLSSVPALPASAQELEVERESERLNALVSSAVGAAETQVRSLSELANRAHQSFTLSEQQHKNDVQAVTQQVAALRASVQEQSAVLDQTFSALQLRFDQSEALRTGAFEVAEQERSALAARANQRVLDATTELTQQTTSAAEELLDLISERASEAEKVVGALAVTGVAAGYKQTSVAEAESAGKWRLATVACAALATVFLVVALFFTDASGDGSWQRLTSRLFVSVSLGGLAAYCGRQSAEHRREERLARARHLQLAALNPYLANMPEADSAKVKLDLAAGYFTPEVLRHDGSDTAGIDPAGMQMLTELVKALASKGNPG